MCIQKVKGKHQKSNPRENEKKKQNKKQTIITKLIFVYK